MPRQYEAQASVARGEVYQNETYALLTDLKQDGFNAANLQSLLQKDILKQCLKKNIVNIICASVAGIATSFK